MGKQMQTLTHHKHQVVCVNVNKEIATKKNVTEKQYNARKSF